MTAHTLSRLQDEGEKMNGTSLGIIVFPNDPDYLGLCAAVTVAIQAICFIISATLKVDKLNDLVGGSNFVLLAWLTFGLAQVIEVLCLNS